MKWRDTDDNLTESGRIVIRPEDVAGRPQFRNLVEAIEIFSLSGEQSPLFSSLQSLR
jgi:hypothetical protein